jgi:molybdenum cofactor synthesis domain-containing protein
MDQTLRLNSLGPLRPSHLQADTLRKMVSCRLVWLALLVPAIVWGPLLTRDSVAQTNPKAVDYSIVVTGSELLSGVYADGHTHFITRTLRPLGLNCVGSMSVDDKRPDIKEALVFARGRSRLVIVTGGLGPTDNDITRETLSEFTGIELKEHPDVLAAMSRRFCVASGELRKNLRRQTLVPVGGSYLKNSTGTAVGLVFEFDEAVIVALPGPPRELQPMVEDQLIPYLSRRFGTRLPGCSITLRFVGLGQSQIDQTLEDHVPLADDIAVSSQFDGGRVDFTFSLPDDTEGDRKRLVKLKEKILDQLADSIYADDGSTLEQCVARLLKDRGEKLVLVESASGGSLAAALGANDGDRSVLAGAFVAPGENRLRQLLQIPDDQWDGGSSRSDRIGMLATRAARVTESDWAVAVGDVRPSADGSEYVEVVLKQPGRELENRTVRLRGKGEWAHFRLTTELLDHLRRKLLPRE